MRKNRHSSGLNENGSKVKPPKKYFPTQKILELKISKFQKPSIIPDNWNPEYPPHPPRGSCFSGCVGSICWGECVPPAYLWLILCVLQGEKNQWQMRRSQKVDKQEILTLQANLQAEIQAKQQLVDEMNKIKAANVANER